MCGGGDMDLLTQNTQVVMTKEGVEEEEDLDEDYA